MKDEKKPRILPTKITPPSHPAANVLLKIRDIGSDTIAPETETNKLEMRIQAANALGDILGEHARKVIPIKLTVYELSMLHTLVSIGMKSAVGQNHESLVRVAGQFREAVGAMWLKLGMTYDDYETLNKDVIVLAPKNPDEKKI